MMYNCSIIFTIFYFSIGFVYNYHFVLYFEVISFTNYGEIYCSYKQLLIYEWALYGKWSESNLWVYDTKVQP